MQYSGSFVIQKLKIDDSWKILKAATGVIICLVVESDDIGLQIQTALKISEDMMMHVFVNSVPLTELGDDKFPIKIGEISKIEQICELVESMNNHESKSDVNQNSDFFNI